MILIVSLTPSTGGAEKYLQNIELYHSNGNLCEVAFITNDKIHKTKFNSNSIVLRGNKYRYLGFFNFLIFWIKNIKKYDRIYSSHLIVNAFIGFLKTITFSKITIIARESTSVFLRYSGFRILLYKFFYKYLYNSINVIVCQTELMKSQLINSVSIKNNIIVLSNPFKYSEFSYESVKLMGELNIVAAGRLIHEKGFDILVESFNMLCNNFNNVHLYILGEGPERNNLENLIQHYNLNKNIHLLGFVTDPLKYFSEADVCVISSRKEGFPNVLLEMLNVNNNVLITPCCGNLNEIPKLTVTKNVSAISLQNSILLKLKNLDNTLSTKKIIRGYLNGLDTSIFIDQINKFLKYEFNK